MNKLMKLVWVNLLISIILFPISAFSAITTSPPDVSIHYALFFGEQEKFGEVDKLTQKCDFAGLRQVSAFDGNIKQPSIKIEQKELEDLALPTIQALQYFGRGFDQAKAERLLKSSFSVSFIGLGPFDKTHLLLKKISKCVGLVAKQHNAFVYDLADAMTFTAPAFEQLRLDEIKKNHLSAAQFSVRAYRIENGIRSVSMGLEKFGHTNLAIEQFSEHHMGYMDKLFSVVLQQVIESETPIEPSNMLFDINKISHPGIQQSMHSMVGPNGSGRATITLKRVSSLQGDPVRLLGIAFKSPAGESLWQEQAMLLKTVFGKDRDVSSLADSDVLQQTIESARLKVKSLLKKQHSLEKDGKRLLLAVALGQTNEIVWVEVTQWQGDKGKGVLLSDPIHTKGLKSGMDYEIDYQSVMDFKLYGPDGLIMSGGVDELARQLGEQ